MEIEAFRGYFSICLITNPVLYLIIYSLIDKSPSSELTIPFIYGIICANRTLKAMMETSKPGSLTATPGRV